MGFHSQFGGWRWKYNVLEFVYCDEHGVVNLEKENENMCLKTNRHFPLNKKEFDWRVSFPLKNEKVVKVTFGWTWKACLDYLYKEDMPLWIKVVIAEIENQETFVWCLYDQAF